MAVFCLINSIICKADDSFLKILLHWTLNKNIQILSLLMLVMLNILCFLHSSSVLSEYIFRVVNSVDPDQMATSEASWFLSTVFKKINLGSAGQSLRVMGSK